MPKLLGRRVYKFLILMVIILSGCSNAKISSESEEQSLEQFVSSAYDTEIKDINQSITLELTPYSRDSLRPDTLFDLLAVNQIKDAVRFPADFNMKIFRFSNHEWLLTQNEVTYLSDEIILADSSLHGISELLPIKLALEHPEEDNLIRVVILGELLIDGEPNGEKVAAYLDLTITPEKPENSLSRIFQGLSFAYLIR